MTFLIADTFTAAFDRLQPKEQKAVKASVFDMQMDPTGNGLQMHRIDKSKDDNFWSLRVNRDLRLIVHKTAASLLLAYVDHHDKAYAWAERRRIEAHPRTGAIQIVEVRERVEEASPAPLFEAVSPEPAAAEPVQATPIFEALDEDALLSIGVPEDWLGDVRAATEESFFGLAERLPPEASEALLEYAATGRLPQPAPAASPEDPYAHPDSLRRIRPIADQEELEQALEFPWEKWGVFLHPSQRETVERTFSGPARIAGSAGTGKTVVALHRAVRLARQNPHARILLTSFSDPLAESLRKKLKVLAPETSALVRRITVASFQAAAEELHQLQYGVRPRIASEKLLRSLLDEAARAEDIKGFSARFLLSEWTNVIDAWGIDSAEDYATVQRMGRKSRLGPKQRERLWPIFASVRAELAERRYTTWPSVFTKLAERYGEKAEKPFGHIVLDEAQDLGPAELRFFAAIAPETDDALFFAGDLGQRIFQHPYSWKSLGIDVRGRSSTLKVCYRTTHQIRSAADRLLPETLRDVDGLEDERRGTVSVFSGPRPQVRLCDDIESEREAVVAFLESVSQAGVQPHEIGLIVRNTAMADRAKAAVEDAQLDGDPSITVMHLAKGLEFRAVAIMACDEDVLPLESRLADAADEAELDDIYETERRLLYVACTRARDHLIVTGVEPGSEFLSDLKEMTGDATP